MIISLLYSIMLRIDDVREKPMKCGIHGNQFSIWGQAFGLAHEQKPLAPERKPSVA
jgi:hypothetical protein